MTQFNLDDINSSLLRRVSLDEVPDELVLNAIRSVGEPGSGERRIRIAAVYDRKGYPAYGPISDKLDSSPHREGDQDVYLCVEVLIDRGAPTDEFKELLDITIAGEERAASRHAEATRKAKQERINSLRAQADKLESEL